MSTTPSDNFIEFISNNVKNNTKELSDFLSEAFLHYNYYDYEKSFLENVQTLIGLHMEEALEQYKLELVNTSSWFYNKESFILGNLHIETKNE
jgi:hypothetical protein